MHTSTRARIANAVAALGCSPADVTWRAGVDVLSLGATKNGALSAEAIVAFDDRIADELVYRTKRSGHVTSKMRFQSAQVAAYLTDGLWLRLAANANLRMAALVTELKSLASHGVRLQERVDVNMAFVEMPASAIDAAAGAGVLFYPAARPACASSRAGRRRPTTSPRRVPGSARRCSPGPDDLGGDATTCGLTATRADRSVGDVRVV